MGLFDNLPDYVKLSLNDDKGNYLLEVTGMRPGEPDKISHRVYRHNVFAICLSLLEYHNRSASMAREQGTVYTKIKDTETNHQVFGTEPWFVPWEIRKRPVLSGSDAGLLEEIVSAHNFAVHQFKLLHPEMQVPVLG